MQQISSRDLAKLTDLVGENVGKYNSAVKLSFSEICEKHTVLPSKPGAYVISDKTKKRTLYVGSTGKGDMTIRRRICEHLLSGNIHKHVLANKLIGDGKDKYGNKKLFSNKEKFLKYIQHNWELKYLTTEDELDAKMLEYALIKLLRPQYNSEIMDFNEKERIRTQLHNNHNRLQKIGKPVTYEALTMGVNGRKSDVLRVLKKEFVETEVDIEPEWIECVR